MEKYIKTIKRNKCVICDDVLGTVDFILENFPIYMGTTLDPIKQDKTYDQKWAICKKCGCIQLFELIPLNELYSENHHQEVVGKLWEQHHNEFAEFILESSPKSIIEIGGAHGFLSKIIRRNTEVLKYVFVEPDSNLNDEGVLHVKGFIEDNLQIITKNDSIIHSHVLEHTYNPREFLYLISGRMGIGAKMFISFPNIIELIRTGGANSLNFEHTYFLTPVQIETLFENYGFIVKRKTSFIKHSYFYEIEKITEQISNSTIQNILQESIRYIQMQSGLRKFVFDTNQIMLNSSFPTFIFGAHVFSQNLLVLGLNASLIQGVIDNSPSKQNQRLYGSELKVFNPSIIADCSQVNVILKTTHYQSEIKEQLISINKNVTIIE